MTEHASERETDAPHSSPLTSALLGGRGGIASTVYGTVVVMATLTVAFATEKSPWKLAVLVSTTAFVLWIAHLYAHGLSESISRSRRLTMRELVSIAGREKGILLAAAFPSAALVLGAADVLHETAAVWLALGIGLTTLAAEGVRYSRIERLGALATLAVIAGNLALGLFVVILKVAVAH
jgi:hypothetical protein